MATNNRIFYACQAVNIVSSTGGTVGASGTVRGVQSVGMSANFTLDQVFEMGQLEIYENTLMFFTSDNGAAKRFDGIHDSCGVMQGKKRSLNEGGIRVPMVARWPGKIKPGSVSDHPWYFPDVMPTLAEIAGVSKEVPKDVDGISVLPTLLGKGEQKQHE